MKFFVGLILTAFVFTFIAGCETSTAPVDGAAGSGGASDGSGSVGSGSANMELPPLADVAVEVGEPSGDEVVAWGAAVDKPSVAVGDVVTLAIRAKMDSAWHIYALKGTNTTGVNVPTTLDLKLPAGLEQVGDWDIPESHLISEDTYAYDADVVFRTQVKATAAGSHAVSCAVGFQSCNESSCRPPTSTEVKANLTVQ